ncbi:MAG TPA: DnaB-like helicase N-terminal domain-containing protein [Verrucomicrobiae bacterium]|nr:DnaB-like helicase N-terminal domain-containing protein [Verrucomicrobiae bacterium]
MAKKNKPVLSKVAKDALPPHDDASERAALGCVLLEADRSANEQEALLGQLGTPLFYDQRHRVIFPAMVNIRMENHALDPVTLVSFLKDKKQLADAGGFEYVSNLVEAAPSVWNFPTYLATLREKALRRWMLSKQNRLTELAHATEITPEQLRAEFSEIYDQSERIGGTTRPRLKIWRAKDIIKHEVPKHLALVGDNEICMGYDGVVVLAGPGSSGKSLCTASLALAGAIGSGTWMGRKIHRKFKTLIIQAENGITRLKKEVEALCENHPKVDIHGHIFFSEPPEGGLPFHSPEFRNAVKRAISELQPDLVVVDPWSQVASEDAAKEVVDKLGEIRSCFPAGDQCPGLLIVAHTKKPRAGEVHRGRSLTALVSGSVALPNTARCVYVLLPWSEDPEDRRIYWCCPKLNNGEMYAASVWERRFGTLFQHDGQTNPLDWGKEMENDEAQAITLTDLKAAFGDQAHLTRAALTRRLMEKTDCSSATAYRAIQKGGYLAQHMETTDEGWFKIKG